MTRVLTGSIAGETTLWAQNGSPELVTHFLTLELWPRSLARACNRRTSALGETGKTFYRSDT